MDTDDLWTALLGALPAVLFATALLVLCGKKTKPNAKPTEPAQPTNSTAAALAKDAPTANSKKSGEKQPVQPTNSTAAAPAKDAPTANSKKSGEKQPAQPTNSTAAAPAKDAPTANSKKEKRINAEGDTKSPVPKKQPKYSNSAISEAQADFAVKLLLQISQQEGDASVIMSPISVAVTLAMVYAGAKEETKAQLAKLIGNGESDEEIHKHFSSVLQELSAEHAKYTLEAANRVYAQETFTVLDTFRADIERYYRGEFKQVDFKQSARTAREINDFVAQKTRQRIRNIISPSALDKYTRLVLINAIYFKGIWAKKFDKSDTKEETFYVSEGNEAKVDMMHQIETFIYYKNADAQVLGLPYEGDELFMFVILPTERYGLRNVLDSLDGKKLATYLGKRGKRSVDVKLPRFKAESELALNERLTALGLTDAFDPDKANFDGIGSEPTFISQAHQKVFIEVNEEGAEAAAATYSSQYPTCADVLSDWSSGRSIPRFVADHPFLYVIATDTADALFIGTVTAFP